MAVEEPRNPAEVAAVARHASRGRTGRNVPVATAVGLGLGGAVVTTVVFYRPAFVALVALAVAVGTWELSSALRRVDLTVPLAPVLVGGVAMVAATWYAAEDGLVVALLLTLLVGIAWVLTARAQRRGPDVAATVFVIAYLPLLASFAVLLARPDDGAWRVLTFVILVVCSDVGGFAIGANFGKHPMAPTISPKKSWEGLAGSVGACVIAGVALAVLALDGVWWHGVVLGIAAVASATLGDLGESAIKRSLQIKDMSTLLPGHGGVMDRLDSLLATAPVGWVLLTAILPPT